MSLKMNIPKRILILFMVALITFNSVFFSYTQSVKSAEWVGGVVAAVGSGPVLTALLIGGVVVAGGVALYELSQTDASDHRNFISGIKQGFNEFVSNQEKQIALENNSSLTDQEASDIGVANARETVNNFFDNAIETSKNTVTNVKKKTLDYWNEFSKQINDVADNGITNSNGEISIGDVLKKETIPGYSWNDISILEIAQSAMPRYTSSNEIVEYNGNKYICKGVCYYNSGVNNVTSTTIDNSFFIPFVSVTYSSYVIRTRLYIYRRDTDTFSDTWGRYRDYYPNDNEYDQPTYDDYIRNLSNSNIPIIYGFTNSSNDQALVRGSLGAFLGLVGNAGAVTPTWKRTINDTLNDTYIGNAIKTGRREVVNTGDYITGIFKEDSVPVKKSTLSVNEGTVSGTLGWDIPAGNVWDDVFSGNKPYADVVGQTGAIGVPDDVITGVRNGDTVIDYPDDALIQDTSDYPNTDVDDDDIPEEIPDRPQNEVFEEQGGTFYPNAFDLTMIFPFCIPFDIIYLIDKFDVGGSNAPVITIPIKYPSVIQSSMGTDHYDVVIDFEDFIVLRNIIRIFLLLLFIVGLMKITRDLIRG